MSNIVTSGLLDSSVRPSNLTAYSASTRTDADVTYRLEGISGGLTWDADTLTWDQEIRQWGQMQ